MVLNDVGVDSDSHKLSNSFYSSGVDTYSYLTTIWIREI